MPSKWFLSTLLTTIGLAALLVAGGLVYNKQQFRKTAVVAQGTVVAINSDQFSLDGGTMTRHWPVVRFVAINGKPHFFAANVSSSSTAYAKNDLVTVCYSPQHPEAAQLDGFWENWLGAGVLGLIGGAFLAAGALSRRFAW